MTLLRVAAGLAVNGAAEHRWRRISVPTSALLFMTFLLAAAGILMLTGRESDRAVVRTAVLAQTPSDTDLVVVVRPDDWRGRFILVAWVAPASPDANPVLPPGLRQLPGPGQAAVSPALDRLAAQHPELGARYPHRTVITAQGTHSGGELFAYVGPPSGRSLGSVDAAFRIEDGRVVGDGPAFRVGGFGPQDHAVGFLQLTEPESVPAGAVLAGLVGVLVIPGLIILVVGAAAASEVRNHRVEVLRALGAGTSTVAALAVAETLILAVPGLAVGAVAWGLLGPRLTAVPLVGYEVVPGDLGLPWWLLVSLLGVAVASTAAVAALATVIPRRRPAPRPVYGRARLSAGRVVPLAVAAAAFVLGRYVGGYRESDFYLAGFVIAVAGIPAVVPVLLRALGMFLAGTRWALVAIAGRTMEWDPARAARPFVGAAALLFLVLGGTGYITLSRYTEGPPLTDGAAQVVTVEWQDPGPDDLDRLAAAVGSGRVVPVADGGHDHHHDDGSTHRHDGGAGVVSVGASCAELASYVPDITCDPLSPFVLPAAMQPRLTGWLAQIVHGDLTEIRLVSRAGLAGIGSALVLDEAPLTDVDERVRNAAMTTLPAPYVRSMASSAGRESPLIPWLIGGLVAAVTGLMFACLLALVDRLLNVRGHHGRLVQLGISRAKLAALGAWTFALPYVAILVLTFLAGLAGCALLILPTVAMPWAAIGGTAAVAVATGLLGTVCVAFLGAGSALRERE